MFFEKLKRLFSRKEVPEEARELYEKANNTRELLKGLDAILTRNEVESRELTKEIAALEGKEKEEEAKVKSGDVTGRQKRNTLLLIRRMRKQLDNLDHRLRIYDRNMNLHLNLIGKIQDMEAMQLRGVKEEQIDEILLDFESNMEDYAGTLTAASIVESGAGELDSREERELKKIEEEILGEESSGAEKEKEGEKKTKTREKEAKEEARKKKEKASSSTEELPSESAEPKERFTGEMELE
jgi:hypothetical protein